MELPLMLLEDGSMGQGSMGRPSLDEGVVD